MLVLKNLINIINMDIGHFRYYLVKKNIMKFLKRILIKMEEITFMLAGEFLIMKNFIKD